MSMSVISAPAVEVLDATDAVLRQHLRLEADETEQNSAIDAYAAAARAKVEAFTHRALITQTIRLTLDGFCPEIELPIAPVQSIGAVSYLDATGVWTDLDAADYRLITSQVPYTVRPAYGTSWPVPRLDAATVRVDCIVGYGAAGTDVPPDILHAIRLLVAHYFFNREAVTEESLEELPMGVRSHLMPHVFWV